MKKPDAASTHDWLWLHIIGGWQIVRCRNCGKHEKYRPMGFAATYPSIEGCRGR